MADYSIYVGIAAGTCTSISLVPQLIKVIKEKKAKNISLFMLFILLAGVSTWVWYGILREDYPIIITNGFSLIIDCLIIYFSIKHKQN